MRIIHTSDWHLGRTLYGCRRYEEFEAFLDWMVECVENNKADALIISGDIFDTTTPGNTAQNLYYRFLCRLAGKCTLVITGGNHDSPSFLQAPSGLLETLNIHVVGSACENIEEEVIVFNSRDGAEKAIVCAVPYLRDRDVRASIAGESFKQKEEKLVEGIRNHYEKVCNYAEKMRDEIGEVPVIAMGHLFTSGGKTVEGDGVRELYIGSLAHVNESVFPECIDYIALGHLHIAQPVGKSGRAWYSGSPLPMGFNEASTQKQVLQLDFTGREVEVTRIQIPSFRYMQRISGTIEKISGEIEKLKLREAPAWVEVEYTGEKVVGNLRNLIDEMVDGSYLEIVRIKNRALIEKALKKTGIEETLDDLDVYQVFDRCLDSYEVPEAQRPGLKKAYRELVVELQEKDVNKD
jgi:exonuclease SbcD